MFCDFADVEAELYNMQMEEEEKKEKSDYHQKNQGYGRKGDGKGYGNKRGHKKDGYGDHELSKDYAEKMGFNFRDKNPTFKNEKKKNNEEVR